ncbi:MAG: peptide chain release factor 2, partial [Candidatus Cloacimonetes bacterium]|nr:peptide chain release factor 2 [Candidatus Cloacimonadota bacterium]
RHTSFSMVEVIPKLEKMGEIEIPEDDLKVDFAKSSGPGGQNVNKRETAVRIVHIPTNISVHVESERSQAQNREKAMQMIEAKLIKKQEEEMLAKEKGMQISTTTENEWGSQIRSYVFHPYQMVKDHRTNFESGNTNAVMDGDLLNFMNAYLKYSATIKK